MKNKTKIIKVMSKTFFIEKKEKLKLVKFIQNSEKLSMEKNIEKFQKKFLTFLKCKYTIMVNSGDNIGFSALTWSTNLMPIMQLGFEPVPIYVNLNTLLVK